MGAGQSNSSSMSTSAANRVSNNITNHISQSASDHADQDSSTVQRMDVSFTCDAAEERGEPCEWDGCNISLSQTMDVTGQQVARYINDMSAEAVSEIETELKNSMISELTQANEGLSLPQTNSSAIEQAISNDVETTVRNVLDQESRSSAYQLTENEQTMIFNTDNFNCKNSNIDLTQNAQINIMQDKLAHNIMEAISRNEVTNKIVNDQRAKVSQTNAGVDLFGSLASLIIFCPILLLPVFKMLMSSRKNKKVKNAMNDPSNPPMIGSEGETCIPLKSLGIKCTDSEAAYDGCNTCEVPSSNAKKLLKSNTKIGVWLILLLAAIVLIVVFLLLRSQSWKNRSCPGGGEEQQDGIHSNEVCRTNKTDVEKAEDTLEICERLSPTEMEADSRCNDGYLKADDIKELRIDNCYSSSGELLIYSECNTICKQATEEDGGGGDWDAGIVKTLTCSGDTGSAE